MRRLRDLVNELESLLSRLKIDPRSRLSDIQNQLSCLELDMRARTSNRENKISRIKSQDQEIVVLSGGPKREHFAGYRSKQELIQTLQKRFPQFKFQASGSRRALYVLIPDSAERASDTKLKQCGVDCRVMKLAEFLNYQGKGH